MVTSEREERDVQLWMDLFTQLSDSVEAYLKEASRDSKSKFLSVLCILPLQHAASKKGTLSTAIHKLCEEKDGVIRLVRIAFACTHAETEDQRSSARAVMRYITDVDSADYSWYEYDRVNMSVWKHESFVQAQQSNWEEEARQTIHKKRHEPGLEGTIYYVLKDMWQSQMKTSATIELFQYLYVFLTQTLVLHDLVEFLTIHAFRDLAPHETPTADALAFFRACLKQVHLALKRNPNDSTSPLTRTLRTGLDSIFETGTSPKQRVASQSPSIIIGDNAAESPSLPVAAAPASGGQESEGLEPYVWIEALALSEPERILLDENRNPTLKDEMKMVLDANNKSLSENCVVVDTNEMGKGLVAKRDMLADTIIAYYRGKYDEEDSVEDGEVRPHGVGLTNMDGDDIGVIDPTSVSNDDSVMFPAYLNEPRKDEVANCLLIEDMDVAVDDPRRLRIITTRPVTQGEPLTVLYGDGFSMARDYEIGTGLASRAVIDCQTMYVYVNKLDMFCIKPKNETWASYYERFDIERNHLVVVAENFDYKYIRPFSLHVIPAGTRLLRLNGERQVQTCNEKNPYGIRVKPNLGKIVVKKEYKLFDHRKLFHSFHEVNPAYLICHSEYEQDANNCEVVVKRDKFTGKILYTDILTRVDIPAHTHVCFSGKF